MDADPMNRLLILTHRPEGLLTPRDVELVKTPIPEFVGDEVGLDALDALFTGTNTGKVIIRREPT